MSLLELFCDVDDFCQTLEPEWHQQLLESSHIQRKRASQLRTSEIMTILIHFHQSRYRDFKTYYTEYVSVYLHSEFPHLVSYQRLVELTPRALILLLAYFQQGRGLCTGISFVDATSLAVCHNRRIARHQVVAGLAQQGKTTFYGFKLHLVVNDRGEILAFYLSPGNVDDREPIPHLTQNLFGKLFADKGYLSHKLFLALWERGLQLITGVRKNMPNCLIDLTDKPLLRQRSIIETIHDQLKTSLKLNILAIAAQPIFLLTWSRGSLLILVNRKKPH